MTAGSTPLLSVVVPTLGIEARVTPFLDALGRQTLPRERWELIAAFDGARASPAIAARLEALGARSVILEPRQGPPRARNAGVAAARGEYVVSTDDDVVPDDAWLERIAIRLDDDPSIDVVEGATRKPGGRSVRRAGADEARQYILCNLVMRRSLFERVGGFHPGYFEPRTGLFFREDADIGWKLEAAGAHVVRATEVVVTHPEENPRWLDPLRWTRRYVMDGLLAARFPREFRERIEVHRFGPLAVRRPIVRASGMYVLSLALAAILALAGRRDLGVLLLIVAAVCVVPIWAKWRFDLRRLPVILLVPFGLMWALARGWWRARGIVAADRAAQATR